VEHGARGLSAPVTHVASGTAFQLSLAALSSGAVRLRLTEVGKERYTPPDVLLPEAEAAVVAWASVTQPDKKTLELTPATGDVTYRLATDPLRLDMVRAALRLRAAGGCAVRAVAASSSATESACPKKTLRRWERSDAPHACACAPRAPRAAAGWREARAVVQRAAAAEHRAAEREEGASVRAR
jgi:hypothetical protein